MLLPTKLCAVAASQAARRRYPVQLSTSPTSGFLRRDRRTARRWNRRLICPPLHPPAALCSPVQRSLSRQPALAANKLWSYCKGKGLELPGASTARNCPSSCRVCISRERVLPPRPQPCGFRDNIQLESLFAHDGSSRSRLRARNQARGDGRSRRRRHWNGRRSTLVGSVPLPYPVRGGLLLSDIQSLASKEVLCHPHCAVICMPSKEASTNIRSRSCSMGSSLRVLTATCQTRRISGPRQPRQLTPLLSGHTSIYLRRPFSFRVQMLHQGLRCTATTGLV